MTEELSKPEAVQLAVEQLGDAPPEVAAFIEVSYGLKVQPAMVPVLRASLREQEHLARMRRVAREVVEQARAQGQAERGGKRPPPPWPAARPAADVALSSTACPVGCSRSRRGRPIRNSIRCTELHMPG